MPLWISIKIFDSSIFILFTAIIIANFIFRCDADPQALAKYVVALVKKDKPEANLKALCKDQLDVFLQKGKLIFTQF